MNEINLNVMGNRLKQLRERRNYSQVKVAKDLGLSNVQLSRYESGDRNPDQQTITALANYYEVTTDFLYGRDVFFTTDYSNVWNENALKTLGSMIQNYVGFEEYDQDFEIFDFEEWKSLSPNDVTLINEHFKMIVKLAKQRKAK